MSRIGLVTGAGSGIGRASAIALAQAGFVVVLSGRRRERLEEVAGEAGNGSIAIPADVRDPESVSSLFTQVEERFGRLDLLFNNAGVVSRTLPLEDLLIEDWRAVVDTCLTGAFLCTQHAFRIMKQQSPRGGRIINNGSVAAHVPRPLSAPYTAAKHGITGLTKSTSLDGRPFDIACGQIDIGNADTDLGPPTDLPLPARTTEDSEPDDTAAPEPMFEVDNVARAIVYMATLPLDTNVQFMTLMATTMPYIGRG